MLLAMLRKGILDIPLMFAFHSLIPAYGIVAVTPVTDLICCIIAAVLFIKFIRSHGHNKFLSSISIEQSMGWK